MMNAQYGVNPYGVAGAQPVSNSNSMIQQGSSQRDSVTGNDYLKSKLIDLEKRHSSTLQEMMSQYDQLMRSQIEKEVKDIANKLTGEKQVLENELAIQRQQNREMEEHMVHLTNELEKASKVVMEKHAEIEAFRGRMTAMESEKALELEELAKRLSDEKEREMEVRLAELNRAHGEERIQLEEELNFSREQLIDLENKTGLLIQSNEKLTELNTQRLGDIDSLRIRNEQLEAQHAAEVSQLSQNFEVTLKAKLDRETTELQTAFALEKGKLESQIRSQSQRLHECDNNIRRFETELGNERARSEQRQREIDDLRKHLEVVQLNYRASVEEFKKNLEMSQRALIQTHEIGEKFDAERAAFETQLLQFQQKARENDALLANVVRERDDAASLVIERLKQVDQLKHEFNTREAAWRKELATRENEIESLTRNALDAKELNTKFGSDKAAYETQIKQLKQLNENSKVELQKLYEVMNTRKKEAETSLRKNEELRGELARLLDSNAELSRQVSELREKNEFLTNSVTTATNERDNYRGTIERSDRDLSLRNKALVEKVDVLNELHGRYEQLMAHAQRLGEDFAGKLNK